MSSWKMIALNLAAILSSTAAAVDNIAAPVGGEAFAPATAIDEAVARAKASLRPGQANSREPITTVSGYRASAEYRVRTTPPLAHPNELEVIVILDGSGKVIVGGTLQGSRPGTRKNLTGDAIIGGESRNAARGDVIIVPANTPHQFLDVHGSLSNLTIHVPLGAGASGPAER